MTPRHLLPITFAALLFSANAGVAHADLTVVTSATISGPPQVTLAAAGQAQNGLQAGKPKETKTYYKGEKMRTDVSDTMVVITDTDGHIYTLNPTAKTYYVSDVAAAAAPTDPILASLKFDATATVTPSANHKSLLGRDAVEFDYTGKLNITASDPQLASILPTVTMSGQRWTTDSIKDAAEATRAVAAMAKAAAVGMLTPAVTTMAKQLSNIKGFPLEDHLTLTMTFPDGSPAAELFGAESGPVKFDITNEVKSVSEDAIADELFAVPAGYTKTTAPAVPGLPGSGPAGGNL